MKVQVTEKGVHAPTANGEVMIPVGEVIEINGDVIPPALINKVVIIGKATSKTMVVNPEKDDDDPNEKFVLIEHAKSLGINATENWKIATLKTKIAEAEEAAKKPAEQS